MKSHVANFTLLTLISQPRISRFAVRPYQTKNNLKGDNMKTYRILLGAIASFALVNNVYAANNTHVTDTLGAGNSRMDISYGIASGNLPGTYVFAGGPSISDDLKVSTSRFAAAFYLGVTDRLDVGIFLPLIENTKITETLTGFGMTETLTYKNEGQGDMVIGARYLILDKN